MNETKNEMNSTKDNGFFDVLSIPSNPEELFTLLYPIGHGAFGNVYKAMYNLNKKIYAVKIIQFSQHDIASSYQAIQQEAYLMRLVNSSPNIVKYYGSYFSRSKNSLWLILEYCASGSAIDLMIAMDRPFTEVEIATIMKMVIEGLISLHKENLIHRDIKGANILIAEDGTAKLADFGVGVQVKQNDYRHSKKGTPYWMSPQVVTNNYYSTKTDIWSMGITCVELANGEPPYSDIKPLMVMKKIAQNPPTVAELFKENLSDYSPQFLDFVSKCLTVDEKQRPSAKEISAHPFIKMHAKSKQFLAELVRENQENIESLRKEIEENDEMLNIELKEPTIPQMSNTNSIYNYIPTRLENQNMSNNESNSKCYEIKLTERKQDSVIDPENCDHFNKFQVFCTAGNRDSNKESDRFLTGRNREKESEKSYFICADEKKGEFNKKFKIPFPTKPSLLREGAKLRQLNHNESNRHLIRSASHNLLNKYFVVNKESQSQRAQNQIISDEDLLKKKINKIKLNTNLLNKNSSNIINALSKEKISSLETGLSNKKSNKTNIKFEEILEYSDDSYVGYKRNYNSSCNNNSGNMGEECKDEEEDGEYNDYGTVVVKSDEDCDTQKLNQQKEILNDILQTEEQQQALENLYKSHIEESKITSFSPSTPKKLTQNQEKNQQNSSQNVGIYPKDTINPRKTLKLQNTVNNSNASQSNPKTRNLKVNTFSSYRQTTGNEISTTEQNNILTSASMRKFVYSKPKIVGGSNKANCSIRSKKIFDGINVNLGYEYERSHIRMNDVRRERGGKRKGVKLISNEDKVKKYLDVNLNAFNNDLYKIPNIYSKKSSRTIPYNSSSSSPLITRKNSGNNSGCNSNNNSNNNTVACRNSINSGNDFSFKNTVKTFESIRYNINKDSKLSSLKNNSNSDTIKNDDNNKKINEEDILDSDDDCINPININSPGNNRTKLAIFTVQNKNISNLKRHTDNIKLNIESNVDVSVESSNTILESDVRESFLPPVHKINKTVFKSHKVYF